MPLRRRRELVVAAKEGALVLHEVEVDVLGDAVDVLVVSQRLSRAVSTWVESTQILYVDLNAISPEVGNVYARYGFVPGAEDQDFRDHDPKVFRERLAKGDFIEEYRRRQSLVDSPHTQRIDISRLRAHYKGPTPSKKWLLHMYKFVNIPISVR